MLIVLNLKLLIVITIYYTIMPRRTVLKMSELQQIIDCWSDEDLDICNVNILPPETVDGISDEEEFDENSISVNPCVEPSALQEVVGFIEMESERNYTQGTSDSELIDEDGEQPGRTKQQKPPKRSRNMNTKD